MFDSWGEMGNKGSRGRNGLSKETVDFLVKNTKMSADEIQVTRKNTIHPYKTILGLA